MKDESKTKKQLIAELKETRGLLSQCNISREKQDEAEQALIAAEQKFRGIFENSALGIFRTSPKGRILDANPALARLLGFDSPKQLMSEVKDVAKQLYARPKQRKQLLRKLDECEKVCDFEVELNRRDGETIIARLFIRAERDSSGEVEYLEGFIEDITEQKQAEENYQQQIGLLQTFIDNIPSPVFYKDADGLYLGCNTEFENLFGLKKQDVVGKSDSDLFSEKQAGEFLKKDKQVLKGRGVLTYDAEIRDSRGSKHKVTFRKAALPGPKKSVGGLVGVIIDVTERLKSLEELKRTTDQLSLIIEYLPLVCFTCRADGNFEPTFISPNIVNVTGFDSQMFLGDPGFWSKRIHPRDRKRIFRDFRNLFEKGALEHEYRWKISDGTYRWFANTLRLADSGNGPGQHIVGILHDITEKRLMEEKLTKSRKRYQTIIEDQTDMICRFLPNGTLTFINQSFAQCFGMNKDRPGDSLIYSYVHPLDEQKVCEHVESLDSDNPVGTIEYRVELADRQVRWLSWTVRALTNEVGQIIEYQSVGRDVTEKKQIEEKLRESEERYRTLYTRTPVMLHSIDYQGRIVSVSDYWLESMGYDYSEVIGRKLTDFMTEDSKKYAENIIFPRFFHTGQVSGVPYQFVKKNNEIMDVILSATVDKNEKEEIVRSLAVMVDVTERNRMQRQLQRAKEAAEAANRAKGVFLANMSHEIRTPLNGILGMTELTLKTDLTRKQREYLEMVRQSSYSLLTIINDILDFSKIEAGKVEILREDFNLEATIESTVHAMSVLAKEKGLELSHNVEPDVPHKLRGDPGRLKQVLVNLIGNAVKFTSRGWVHLHIAVNNVKSNDRSGWMLPRVELLFSVADTGKGIPDEKQPMLFNSFTQLDDTFAKHHDGTGLGLAISKKLTEMMGGKIWVESEAGKGSIFYFTAEFEAREYDVPFEDADKPEIPEILPPLKILLAEDNLISQKFVNTFLGEAGHEVMVVENGYECLEALQNSPYDLVLMDIQMPDMDGVEATRRIRKGEYSGIDPDIPIIALTAYAMKEDRDRFLSYGMNGYIAKPIDVDTLLRTIQQVLPSKTKRGETSPSPADDILEKNLLNGRFKGKEDLFYDLADLFISDVPDKLKRIKQELEQDNLDRAAALAHSLSGNASTVGVLCLKTPSVEFRQALKSKDANLVEKRLQTLEEQCHRAVARLKDLMDKTELPLS